MGIYEVLQELNFSCSNRLELNVSLYTSIHTHTHGGWGRLNFSLGQELVQISNSGFVYRIFTTVL